MEKNIKLTEFNTKKLMKSLEGKKALCPSCERRLKLAGALFIYQDKEDAVNYYYVVCRKCEYKKEKQTIKKQNEISDLIEKRIKANRYPYACQVVDDPNIENMLNNVVNGSQKMQLNALEDTLGEWHKEDEAFFVKNPKRRFYARPVYAGEIEVTNKENDDLKKDVYEKNISFAIIHSVGAGQRVYSYVSTLEGHPYDEEAFVAALYMVRVNNMFSSNDIMELYEKIKENSQIVTDFKLKNFTSQ